MRWPVGLLGRLVSRPLVEAATEAVCSQSYAGQSQGTRSAAAARITVRCWKTNPVPLLELRSADGY